jgi:predicted alpha-1,2-mannosidase
MKKIILGMAAAMSLSAGYAASTADECVSASRELALIDTRVGTAASETHTAGLFGKNTEELGQTLPAVLVPNGMNFWTPQTQDTELKCKAPYYYKHNKLQGFRNSHWIVGGCTQDYGSMTLMPLYGSLRTLPEERASRFTHDTEVATPAYYSVQLPDEHLTAEMTATSRAAIFRITYDKNGDGYLVVNPNSDEGEGWIEVDAAKRQIRGYNPAHRIYQGKGEPTGFSGYFVVELDCKPTACGTFHGNDILSQTDVANTTGIGAYFKFKAKKGKSVLVKAASSFTDMEGALSNLQAEIPGWDFDAVRSNLTTVWNNRLKLIEAEGGDNDELSKFYGSLYRTSFLPRTFNDVDGRYPSFGGGKEICCMPKGETYYEDYSMWDTYRALHPLLNILTPTAAGQMMQSLVLKAEQGGWLPIFPCWNSYTAAMIGDHCIAAIGDAYVKGVRNFDIKKAYRYMRKNAFESPETYSEYASGMGRRALKSYLRYGYLPLEDSVKEAYHKCEQTSRTLEYAYDDFVLQQVAERLGYADDAAELGRRAGNWRNVINPETGYVCGRYANGNFLANSNPFDFAKYITEGAPCHNTWYVPHDVPGLIEQLGGREMYVAKLDSMFTQGRYWHGNEPCHQVAWMFNYAGEPQKTQKWVRHIMETEYFNTPGGLAGNDDAGQMSAWYLFAAMGFYPVCPGTPVYQLGSPSFKQLTINLENGRQFRMIAPEASKENIYVKSVKLNGTPLNRTYITHDEITSGATLEFEMSPTPCRE